MNAIPTTYPRHIIVGCTSPRARKSCTQRTHTRARRIFASPTPVPVPARHGYRRLLFSPFSSWSFFRDALLNLVRQLRVNTSADAPRRDTATVVCARARPSFFPSVARQLTRSARRGYATFAHELAADAPVESLIDITVVLVSATVPCLPPAPSRAIRPCPPTTHKARLIAGGASPPRAIPRGVQRYAFPRRKYDKQYSSPPLIVRNLSAAFCNGMRSRHRYRPTAIVCSACARGGDMSSASADWLAVTALGREHATSEPEPTAAVPIASARLPPTSTYPPGRRTRSHRYQSLPSRPHRAHPDLTARRPGRTCTSAVNPPLSAERTDEQSLHCIVVRSPGYARVSLSQP
ncbi:hypothetical protein K488DRAFT_83896 [Vararia minispora EC-137]|uniref:Uncharacterized protein n=1 Tax=Vararia minispora EC-137 TaxID=1314806 RepID=A0ACB8QSZ3_9AGAM|nr:hypothetical protein K488DRAFT_83896 [Vararia minispora EC-137]